MTNFLKRFSLAALLSALLFVSAYSQDTVTGAFEGRVSNNVTGAAIAGAFVQIENEETGVTYNLRTNSKGLFYQGLLAPGWYLIRVSISGYDTRILRRQLKVSFTGEVVPVPVALDPAGSGAVSQTPEAGDIRVEINTTDARRDESAKEEEINDLPIGAATVTRSFDELALLAPGVAPPPQTVGDVAGPGVGPGVGSAGQFAVNGLRSRGNNFTVDGSDNNDEDIGVRRQGFVALIAQPLESVKEYQVITLLAPAQFGRNIGAQVNAVSKGGGNQTHGAIYGSFNTSHLNARNFFDTIGENRTFPLIAGTNQSVLLDGEPLLVNYRSGEEDSFTYGQAGGVLGGPIIRQRTFYFLSAETQIINATKEKSFAVPTVEQRGAFRTGASGTYRNPFTNASVSAIPNPITSGTLFSLFPFPNNPTGVYGENTFTQDLPASGKGVILSGKIDHNFKLFDRQQTVTGRYNFTDDDREIPAVNEAIFSSLLSRIQTQNFSFFYNSQLNSTSSSNPLFNQVRLSFGWTHLNFKELRDKEFLIPSDLAPNTPFLLNAPLRINFTHPAAPGIENTGAVLLRSTDITSGNNPNTGLPFSTVESLIGLIGQVNIAGFNGLGVDVYNFPQDRVNKTYQLADELTWRVNNHSLVFGVDTRRTDLNSDLPRLSRPLITFNGAPRLIQQTGTPCPNGGIGEFCYPTNTDLNPIIRAEDLAGLGATSNFLLTLNVDRPDAKANLRFYQLNFYGQDTWRISSKLSFSYGLRYEFNTPVKEVDRLIEQTFSDPRLALSPGLNFFIGGRTQLYEPDYNNFAPRIGVAYSPNFFGKKRTSVFRAGYGIFYDQILGAVVSQSRNVFPTFLTVNFGGLAVIGQTGLTFFNPTRRNIQSVPVVTLGTVNTLNPALGIENFFDFLRSFYPNAVTATLPALDLDMPMAHHYSFVYEQQLNSHFTISVGYIGTAGKNLLRFTTPNLGSSLTVAPTALQPFTVNTNEGLISIPSTLGFVIIPPRPVSGVGAVNRFETTAASNYNALQTQFMCRFINSLDFQLSYTFSKAVDDVSDVFDLAGAFVLPQNSLTFAGERSAANFDVRHRFAYNLIYHFPKQNNRLGWLTDNLQIASIGRFHTGQPFTVNSTIDVNLDGNLTDRLNTTDGIEIIGSRRQPLRLTAANSFALLAPFGEDGRVKRNSFRAGSILDLDLSITKQFSFGARKLLFRTDIFSILNRVNFGIPVRLLEAAGFGRATNTITPARRVQFSLKYEF